MYKLDFFLFFVFSAVKVKLSNETSNSTRTAIKNSVRVSSWKIFLILNYWCKYNILEKDEKLTLHDGVCFSLYPRCVLNVFARFISNNFLFFFALSCLICAKFLSSASSFFFWFLSDGKLFSQFFSLTVFIFHLTSAFSF